MIFLTGGTGSFGSAYLRNHVASGNNEKVIVYSRDWIKQKELRESLGNPDNIYWVIGDIRDKERLKENMIGCDKVIHAAALKCLHTCEENPTECLKTNVIGTQNIIDVCKNLDIRRAVLISTDKAVLPINIYGTSKKMAEKLWISERYNVARYGNVIGSNGSILPIFKKLISEGVESLPITDERCTRFWLEMSRAIEVVEDALDFDSTGDVFIPKMPSIRIVDLVAALGKKYHVVGMKSGEKLHENIIPPDTITGNPGLDSGNNEHFLTVEEIKESIYGI